MRLAMTHSAPGGSQTRRELDVISSGSTTQRALRHVTSEASRIGRFLKALKDQHATAAGAALFDLAKANRDIFQPGGYYWWDPIAAVIATDDTIGQFEIKRLGEIKAEGAEIGRTVVTENGANVRVAMSVDAPRFEEVLLSVLNSGAAVTIDRTEPTPDSLAKMAVTFEGDRCTYSGTKRVAAGPIEVGQ
jgi:hypothetical protein